jgi:hypothetical protein
MKPVLWVLNVMPAKNRSDASFGEEGDREHSFLKVM